MDKEYIKTIMRNLLNLYESYEYIEGTTAGDTILLFINKKEEELIRLLKEK